jgi:putative phosphoesterase
MRILVCSDSHGAARRLKLAYEQQPEADVLVFLGDGVADAEIFRISGKPCYIVRGNCDSGTPELLVKEFCFLGKKILCTHGHSFHVKRGTGELLHAARECGADLVLYVHTHITETDYVDGIHLLNPGSICGGSYGFADIALEGIVCKTVAVRERLGGGSP